jgi:4,5-dihydroxyphthalate decarboxylase
MTPEFPKSGPVTLRTNLAESPISHALRSGQIQSGLVTFDFCGPKVANQGFKPMLRDDAFDAGELAIGTYLQARFAGKPVALLPAVVMGRPQHHCILYRSACGTLTPRDIEGSRVGTRMYSQTTGIWVRGILRHEYGVDLDRVTWLCADAPHVAEYRDPQNAERLPAGAKPVERMLTDGDIDFALLGNDMPGESGVRHLIHDPHDAARTWCEKYGAVPINHLFVLRAELATTRPDVVREVYRMLLESKNAAGVAPGAIDYHPFGVENIRKALDMFIRYSVEQSIIPQRMKADDMFDETARTLCA